MATEDEKKNAMEYGLASSHALNTVCLFGYLLHYIMTCVDDFTVLIWFSLVFLLVSLVGIGRRIYLGMHSFIDVAGITIELGILAFWLMVHGHIDNCTSGRMVDISAMLKEAVEYVKFLQHLIKLLSSGCRLHLPIKG